MMTTTTTTHTGGASLAKIGWGRFAGVALMAGGPAIFWAYAAQLAFGLAGVALSPTVLAVIVGAIFLFLACVVAGLTVAN